MPTTTETLDLNEALRRLAEIEEECTQAVGFQSTAYPRFSAVMETGDYWKNRVGSIEYAEDGEELDTLTFDVVARFIIGRKTSGFPGDVEESLYKVIARFPDYLNEREGLQSAEYPDFQTYLEWARVVSCSGYTEFADNGGSPDLQVGTEFTVRLTYRLLKEQQYTS